VIAYGHPGSSAGSRPLITPLIRDRLPSFLAGVLVLGRGKASRPRQWSASMSVGFMGEIYAEK